MTRDSVSQDTTDFSSLIAKIPGNTDVIYIPWQLSPRAQAFGQQLKAAGKNITLFGSDGLFDPATWKITGSYDSFFPVDTNAGVVKAYTAAHGGDGEYFGAPTYARPRWSSTRSRRRARTAGRPAQRCAGTSP